MTAGPDGGVDDQPEGTGANSATTSSTMTGSCANTWLIRSPSTGGMPSGGLLQRLGWKRAEEESSTEPAEGLRMFRVIVLTFVCRGAADNKTLSRRHLR